jgi:4'-phosphopantetheinyl transferase
LAREIVEREARSAFGTRDLTWARTEAGRPYLAELPDFHFSISHSGPHVGVAFGGAARCGLDIEWTGRAVELAVARRFAADERDYVESGPAGTPAGRLLEVWTKKESYLKWLGQGLGAGLSRFSVLDSAALGVRFVDVSRAGLIGHICAVD